MINVWFKENLRLNLWLFTIYSWNVMCPVIFRLNNSYRDQWQVTGFIADVLAHTNFWMRVCCPVTISVG